MSSEQNGADLLGMLAAGAETKIVVFEDVDKISVRIEVDEQSEHEIVKKNVEFSTNTIREAMAVLLELGKRTGNARFFDSLATLSNSMNAANAQLIGINKARREIAGEKTGTKNHGLPGKDSSGNVLINNTEGGTVMLTTADLLSEPTSRGEPIDVTPKTK